jgi:hypothetical protein
MPHITDNTVELSHAGLRVMLLGDSLWVQLPKTFELKEGDTIGLSCGKPVGVARVTDVVYHGSHATDGHIACRLRLKIPE